MSTPTRNSGSDEASVESRRAEKARSEQAEPAPDEGSVLPDADLPSLGELAPEAARPSPLDDIAESEREQLPRD